MPCYAFFLVRMLQCTSPYARYNGQFTGTMYMRTCLSHETNAKDTTTQLKKAIQLIDEHISISPLFFIP